MKRKWIDTKVLKKFNACEDGIDMFETKYGSSRVLITDLVRWCIDREECVKLYYANWLMTRCMNYQQYVAYAVFSTEQVLYIYEAKHPESQDKRQCIEAAKKCAKNPTKSNKRAASDAVDKAIVYADDHCSTTAARRAAASVLFCASAAAIMDSNLASETVYAAASAARRVAIESCYTKDYKHIAYTARKKMYTKILKNGIKLLEAKEK